MNKLDKYLRPKRLGTMSQLRSLDTSVKTDHKPSRDNQMK